MEQALVTDRDEWNIFRVQLLNAIKESNCETFNIYLRTTCNYDGYDATKQLCYSFSKSNVEKVFSSIDRRVKLWTSIDNRYVNIELIA